MAVPIRLKRNTVAGNIPTTLLVGEPAFNSADGTLFVGGNGGPVQIGPIDNAVVSTVTNRAPSQAAVYNLINRRPTKVITASYTATTADWFILSNATGGITVTLPSATGLDGFTIAVKRRGGGVVTITSTSAIDGGTSTSLNALFGYDSVTLVAAGGVWSILA